MWLALLPLLLISTKLATVGADSGWAFPGEDNGSQRETTTPQPNENTKGNNIDDAALWLNKVLGVETDRQTENRFKINLTTSPMNFCTTVDGKDGKCVKPQYCLKELPERDPTTLFTYRETTCSHLLTCCALDDVKPTPVRTRTLPPGCGWSNPGGYSLRTTDSDETGFSDFAEFPWMVAVLKKSHSEPWSEKDYISGGTLIHPSVVLTVAHKVHLLDPKELKCRAGEWNSKSQDEILEHQDRNVRKIAVHNEFLQLRAHYDAALLILEQPFQLANAYHISVACLGREMPAPGTFCYSMGWGSSFNDGEYATLLKKIKLPLVDPVTCQRQLRNTVLGSNYLLHHSLCCAGGEGGRDACVGDGGSSLVCPVQGSTPKRYVVYGMVAYGVGCGVKDVPGVYAKVPTMVDWIDGQMKEEQLDTTTYYI